MVMNTQIAVPDGWTARSTGRWYCSRTTLKRLLLLLLAFQMIDALATHFLVGSGLVTEGNAWIAGVVSDGYFIWFKLVLTLLCATALYGLNYRFPAITTVAAGGIVAFYTVVLGLNLGVVLTVL